MHETLNPEGKFFISLVLGLEVFEINRPEMSAYSLLSEGLCNKSINCTMTLGVSNGLFLLKIRFTFT